MPLVIAMLGVRRAVSRWGRISGGWWPCNAKFMWLARLFASVFGRLACHFRLITDLFSLFSLFSLFVCCCVYLVG